MNQFQNILQKFRRKPKPAADIWKDSRYVIKYAFTEPGFGGKDIYCFDDLINLPYERALSSIAFFNELEQNCDAEYMKAHYLKMKEILRSAKIDMYEINKFNEQLGERLFKLPPIPALIERCASVVYFDKSENPTVYDFKYNQQKIKRWQKAFPDGSFFLFQPIKTLVPFLKESEENSKSYQSLYREIEKVDLKHLANLSLQQSESSSSIKTSKAVELSAK